MKTRTDPPSLPPSLYRHLFQSHTFLKWLWGINHLQYRHKTICSGEREEYNQLNLNWFITFKLKSISDGQTDDSDIITTRSQWDILILIDNNDITYWHQLTKSHWIILSTLPREYWQLVKLSSTLLLRYWHECWPGYILLKLLYLSSQCWYFRHFFSICMKYDDLWGGGGWPMELSWLAVNMIITSYHRIISSRSDSDLYRRLYERTGIWRQHFRCLCCRCRSQGCKLILGCFGTVGFSIDVNYII